MLIKSLVGLTVRNDYSIHSDLTLNDFCTVAVSVHHELPTSFCLLLLVVMGYFGLFPFILCTSSTDLDIMKYTELDYFSTCFLKEIAIVIAEPLMY